MTRTPLDDIRATLDNPTDLASVEKLVAPNVTYVSLNYNNLSSKRLMPWVGTSSGGARAVAATCEQVGHYPSGQGAEVEDELQTTEWAAVFGGVTSQSKVLGKAMTSPCSIVARVTDGRVTQMQFIEDTIATTSSFNVGGEVIL